MKSSASDRDRHVSNTAAPLAHASETRAVFVEIDWIEFDYGAVAATRVLDNVLPIH